MKKRIFSLLLALFALCILGIPALAAAQAWEQSIVSGRAAARAELAVILRRWGRSGVPDSSETPGTEEAPSVPTITAQVGSSTFTATLEDSETTRAFIKSLPMTVTMGELNGNEKYYYLPDDLPTNSRSPGTIHSGDLMLYGSGCLVLFYETFSSAYSYTPIGRVDDPSGLAAALGSGNIEVTFLANG